MTTDELTLLQQLLRRLDLESKSVPDEILITLAQACSMGASMMWAEREERMEGISDYVPDKHRGNL